VLLFAGVFFLLDVLIAIGFRECCPDVSVWFGDLWDMPWNLDMEWRFKFAVKLHLWMTYHIEMGDEYMKEPEPMDDNIPENIRMRIERPRDGKVIREYYDELHKDKDNLE
jgi:hypothetical protein